HTDRTSSRRIALNLTDRVVSECLIPSKQKWFPRYVTWMHKAQNEKASRFRALHDGRGVFVIPNPWDIGSARLLAGLGFKALATSSAAAAIAIGRQDHGLTREQALEH